MVPEVIVMVFDTLFAEYVTLHGDLPVKAIFNVVNSPAQVVFAPLNTAVGRGLTLIVAVVAFKSIACAIHKPSDNAVIEYVVVALGLKLNVVVYGCTIS